MPKQTNIKANRRSEVRQQDVFEFGPRIDPAASPVRYNTDVVPQNTRGGSAAALLAGLGLTGDIIQSASAVKEKRNKEDIESGKIAAARGEQLTDNQTEAFIEGYEQMSGAGEGYLQLQKVLEEHAMNNQGATYEEFNATQDVEIKKFLMGRSKYFVQGVLPGAIDLQRRHQREFIGKKQEEFEIDKLAKSRSLMDANIQKIIQAAPEQSQIKGYSFSKALRAELDQAQERGKALGHHRSVASKQMVELMGEKAVDSGDRSLLDFAYEKGPGGIRVVDNEALAKKVIAYEEQADAEKARASKERELAVTANTKQLHADITASLAEYAGFAQDPSINSAERKAMRKSMEKKLWQYSASHRNPEGIQLTYQEIEHFRSDINSLTGFNDSLFASESVPDALHAFRRMARENPDALTPEFKNGMKPFLSKADYTAALDLEAQTRQRWAEQGHKPSEAEKDYIAAQKRFAETVTDKDPWGISMDVMGDKREAMFFLMSDELADIFVAENKRYPNRFEAKEIFDRTAEYVNSHPEYGLDDEGNVLGGRNPNATLSMSNRPYQNLPKGSNVTEVINNGFQKLRGKKE